jgi:hypothetical protein
MLKKIFTETQFGDPHPWSNEYFQNVGKLGATGWYFKIFTPNKYENLPSNVEIIPMTLEEFNTLIENKLGVNPHSYLKNGVPTKPVSDFYVAHGKIFEDYLKDADYWGFTNWDIVYGQLSRFIPDELLAKCDIFSDEINTINGIFTLVRNNEKMNNLFKEIPDWEMKLTTHKLFGTDEYDFTKVAQTIPNFLFPKYYPLHSHDRLEQHLPEPKLSLKEDGSLWELFNDVKHPNWEHARPLVGREIPYFHFITTKKWPTFK